MSYDRTVDVESVELTLVLNWELPLINIYIPQNILLDFLELNIVQLTSVTEHITLMFDNPVLALPLRIVGILFCIVPSRFDAWGKICILY